MKETKNFKWTAILLGILQIFIGFWGILGGWGLVSNPSGANVGMTTDALQGSPFSDYLIPGIVLLAVNGVVTLLAGVMTLMRWDYAGQLAMLLGLFMIAWIVIQVMIVEFHWLQPTFFLFGLAEFLLGYFYRKGKQKETI